MQDLIIYIGVFFSVSLIS